MRNVPNATDINYDHIVFKNVSIDNILHLHGFRCGNGSMERFLLDAYYHHLMREASTTLAYYNDEMIAYYTIKHQPIKFADIESEYKFSLDISRLAVSTRYQGKGIGTFIVRRIIQTAVEFNERFITLDALKDRWTWYKDRFGFDYLFEEDLLNQEQILVSMYLDLFDQKLLDEYFDQ